jgi:hypothetical protein
MGAARAGTTRNLANLADLPRTMDRQGAPAAITEDLRPRTICDGKEPPGGAILAQQPPGIAGCRTKHARESAAGPGHVEFPIKPATYRTIIKVTARRSLTKTK